MDGQCVLKGHMPKQLYSIVQDLQVIHTSIQAVLVGKLLRQRAMLTGQVSIAL